MLPARAGAGSRPGSDVVGLTQLPSPPGYLPSAAPPPTGYSAVGAACRPLTGPSGLPAVPGHPLVPATCCFPATCCSGY